MTEAYGGLTEVVCFQMNSSSVDSGLRCDEGSDDIDDDADDEQDDNDTDSCDSSSAYKKVCNIMYFIKLHKATVHSLPVDLKILKFLLNCY